MLNQSEKEELEQLRKSAHAFITCPMEKAFFHLESLMDKPYSEEIRWGYERRFIFCIKLEL